jgi:hypothetical protein
MPVMALGASIADAFVTLRPDFSAFDGELDRGMRDALGDVERLAESTGEAIEGSFREAAAGSDAALESIGEAEVWNDLAAEAERAGESIQRSFQEAARQSDSSLDGISAKGAASFGGLGKVAGVAAVGLGAVFAGGALASGLQEAVDLASDLGESVNAVNVTFGRGARSR